MSLNQTEKSNDMQSFAKEICVDVNESVLVTTMSNLLSILSRAVRSEFFVTTISSSLNAAADIIENESVNRTIASSLRSAVKFVENDMIMSSVSRSLKISSNTLKSNIVSGSIDTSISILQATWNTTTSIYKKALENESLMQTINSISNHQKLQDVAAFLQPITLRTASKVKSIAETTLSNPTVQEFGMHGYNMASSIISNKNVQMIAFKSVEKVSQTVDSTVTNPIVQGAFESVSSLTNSFMEFWSGNSNSDVEYSSTEINPESLLFERVRDESGLKATSENSIYSLLEVNDIARKSLVRIALNLEEELRLERESHELTKEYANEIAEALAEGCKSLNKPMK